MATLFSYFTKTPKKPSSKEADKADGLKENTTPVSGAKIITHAKKEKSAKPGNITPCGISNGRVDTSLKNFEIVWAKMEGHPWWPSMICNHPTLNTFVNDKQCHVQFFGEPPSRGWVNIKQIQPFIKGQSKPFSDPSVKDAIKDAENALKFTTKERDQLIKCVPSDDEDLNEEISDELLMECDLDALEYSQTIRDKSDSNDESDNDEVTGKKYNSKLPKRRAKTRRPHKRKRIIIESGSEDGSSSDEFKPDKESSEDDSISSGVEECEDNESMSEEKEEEEEQSNSRKRKRGSTSSKPKSKKLAVNRPVGTVAKSTLNTTPVATMPSALANKISNSASKAASLLSKFQMTSSTSTSEDKPEDSENGYVHEKLQWLKEGKRKDKHGRAMSHPEYDPKTLLVPSSYLTSKEVTPAMRQWWILKSENFDTILFFKVGKFYELYHTDAVIGVKELNLIFMKGNFAHAGFPEIAYDRYSDTLIQKGYKVARVEQTETPEMMKERCRKERTNSRYDQVVKREVCAVTTKGTRMYSFRDGECTDSEAAYLLAIAEKGYDGTTGGGSVYGVCFLDTSIGKFHMGQFEDDRHASRLRTLIAHHAPVQVLCPRGSLTSKTQHVISHELMSALTEYLNPGTEFWDSSKTLKFLAEGKYFQDDKESESPAIWPAVLKEMTSGDPLCLMATDECELAVSALGAVVWYLKKCLIEDELLSMAKFEKYHPLDCVQMENPSNYTEGHQRMILDDVTLTNLDILPCGVEISTDGTLLERIDCCCTAFGKRLIRQWLCAPLCSPSAINDRLNAIEDLMAVPAAVAEVKDILKTLPDLERLLRKIHSMGSHTRAHNHPDGRAILYHEDTYSKRKITDFLSTLEGFTNACCIIKQFKEHVEGFNSRLLKKVTTYEDSKESKYTSGKFPKLHEVLKFFKNAFDHAKAKKDGVIVPKPGVNMPYDEALDDIKTCKNWFDQYLEKQQKRLKCRSIGYWGTAKNRFQLEVPDSVSKNAPDEYTLQSQKKGFRRYWTSEIEKHLAILTDAEERRDVALKDTMRTIFQKFDSHYDMWDKAVQCVSVLDALVSLTTYSSQGEGPMCRPEVVPPQKLSNGTIQPFLEIREGRHPCILRTFSGGDFIPNDTIVGIADKEHDAQTETKNAQSLCVLVTGPNMGGKSTLMRQAGLITIMAQLGCYVPAEKCRLTPVDRVFTRLGAHDRIMAGESTFFVELSETSTILRHSTVNSLVLLDELGRGTATFDGTAIACAVVRELSTTIRCRTLFSTHYHSLVEEFASDSNVRLGHMACMVENDDEEGDPSKETITFLYKFVKGDCPKSYGFNAARLAGIPDEIISVAVKKARDFEETLDDVKLFKLIVQNKSNQQSLKVIMKNRPH